MRRKADQVVAVGAIAMHSTTRCVAGPRAGERRGPFNILLPKAIGPCFR